MQKSNIRDKKVSQDNNYKAKLNPVTLLALTVQRLLSYPGCSRKWELYTFNDGKKFSKITAKNILIDLRCSVDAIDVDVLGFTSNEIGTHSVKASLAMMMYLAKE